VPYFPLSMTEITILVRITMIQIGELPFCWWAYGTMWLNLKIEIEIIDVDVVIQCRNLLNILGIEAKRMKLRLIRKTWSFKLLSLNQYFEIKYFLDLSWQWIA
jgi:hypothetical protein